MFSVLSENLLGILFIVILIGYYLGSFKWRGISLGPAAIFLTAVVFGHFGIGSSMPRLVLEIGLAFFVYAVGFQVGPKFIKNFSRGGWQMIGAAFVMVLCAMITTILVAYFRNLPVDLAAGLFAGSVTNTPSLAAAIDIISRYGFGESSAATGGYGITYIFSVVSSVLFVQILPRFLKRNIEKEEEKWAEGQKELYPQADVRQYRVENRKCFGKSIAYLNKQYMHKNDPINMSRVLRCEEKDGGKVLVEYVATPDFILEEGDMVVVVAKSDCLGPLDLVFGEEVSPLQLLNQDIDSFDAEVTSRDFDHKQIGELPVLSKLHLSVTRIIRDETTIFPHDGTMIEMGDILRFVGHRKEAMEFVKLVTAKNKSLDKTTLLTFIFGIVFGILLGSIPIPIPGGSPIYFGNAGGLLVSGIILSNWKRIGKLEIHFPPAALEILQDLGLLLFMAGAGLIAGARFMGVFKQFGLELLLEGMFISLVTLFAGAVYLWFMKANTLQIMAGVAAGMTQPSALDVTKTRAKTELPLLAYTAIYPFAMIFKIGLIQILVLIVHFMNSAPL